MSEVADDLTGIKVMVVDDSNTIRRSAEIFLAHSGCEIILATDGFDAIAKVVDCRPDIIFLDIVMPRLDGYQTCMLIKKSKVSIAAGCHAIQQKWVIRPGTRQDDWFRRVPDQAVHQRGVA